MENTQKPKRKITCDEVVWIKDILERLSFISGLKMPSVSRTKRMAIFSALYELMEVLRLDFEDDKAKHNATPEEVKKVLEDITKSENSGD